ncbi:hypothetical protein FQZ97_767440 [compost metagenome]
MRNAALGAVRVKRLTPPHTQRGLERTKRIVDTRMDHLAVARAGAGPDRGFTLEHHHLSTSQGKSACHRQSYNASPDNEGIHVLHDSVHCLKMLT